jgi:hypothetical protein
MKKPSSTISARQVIRQISELRELGRRLAQAGYKAGLHDNDPNRLPSKIAETPITYRVRDRR